ncbi:flagellar export chaperone FliS [Aliidiomarina sedimenti]|uniref:Flagellar secretion chaperone FliS n=1 Tax=Aliidiomarina sedimenti TaxID=1933879 RepID=A0ABY0BZE8_9GAMM|nr:flagellar export chaperone FliS [Aliidiomarina sedimenti]RUO29897.1 flagellar export chaperone FliS [Aliidiomarina sedimenti]
MYKKGVNAYQSVGGRDQATTADPYQLIQMLMNGALQKLAISKGAMERKDLETKSENLTKALSIVSALQEGLDMTVDSEVVNNMFDLYDYMKRQIVEAMAENKLEAVDNCLLVMRNLKEGWDAIPVEARNQAFAQRDQMAVGG